VQTFTPFVDADLAIVGLEPSCLLSLRDELLVMGLGEPAQRLAAQRCCSRSSWPANSAPAA